jgi:hypothetical protein
LYAEAQKLPKDAPVYVKTGNGGKQVKSYMVARADA